MESKGSRKSSTKKALSLLKKAVRTWKAKRSRRAPTLQHTTISGLTVGPGRRRSRSAEKGPKKGDSVIITRSGHPLIGPVVVWGRGIDEPITPGFLADLARELKENHK